MGYTIRLDSLNLTAKAGCSASPATVLYNGNQATIAVTCTTGLVGDKFRSDIRLGFTRLDTNISQSWNGELLSSVQ
jgi:hypothetical protein